MSSIHPPKRPAKRRLPIDARQQLFNGCAVGPIEKIQVSTERITQLHGILFDLDPAQLRKSSLIPSIPTDPVAFYRRTLEPWLRRQPVLNGAEVRMSGTGLHIIPWFTEPVEFQDQGVRDRWCAIVKVVQAALPTDPQAPGITATTRAIGSINSKCNRKVRLLKKGCGVTIDEITQLYEQMCEAPFKTVVEVVAGTGRLTPCPFCNEDDQTLKALHYVGECYGSCGRVTFMNLGELLFRDKSENKGRQRDAKKSR